MAKCKHEGCSIEAWYDSDFCPGHISHEDPQLPVYRGPEIKLKKVEATPVEVLAKAMREAM